MTREFCGRTGVTIRDPIQYVQLHIRVLHAKQMLPTVNTVDVRLLCVVMATIVAREMD